MVLLPEVSLGGFLLHDHPAGVIDLGSTQSGEGFDGILGLDCFTAACITIDPGSSHLIVSDAVPDGIAVPVDVRRDGRAISMFAPLELPSGRVVTVEVDTGSAALILDEQYLPDCQVAIDDPRVEERHGSDETGHVFTRRFVTIDGAVGIPAVPQTVQQGPRVMFQQIIYDGLVGTDFLHRFRCSFDVRGKRLVLRGFQSSTT